MYIKYLKQHDQDSGSISGSQFRVCSKGQNQGQDLGSDLVSGFGGQI